MILKPLWGTPSDEEIMGIHAVILVANKVIDAKYQSRASGAIFPDLTIYTPPTLPAHVTVDLNAVLGAPSEEEIIKVRSAIRSYHQFANVPSIFDPRVDMKLSQHLFDIQMAGYIHRASQSQATPKLREASSSSTTVEPQRMPTGESLVVTDNAGIGATTAEPHESTRTVHGVSIQEAIERSNRLAEQTNKLIERSNQIAERANQLVEQSSHSEERSNKLAERSNELFGRLNQHLEESNRLARESTRPVENLGDVLMNINRVLVRIQHVIVRSHKGNTLSALGFLVNEKGETPETSRTTQNRTYTDFSSRNGGRPFPVVISGVSQTPYISDAWLGEFIRFYCIDDGLFDDASTVHVTAGKLTSARTRLSDYLTACLG